ncbi:MAG: hypothetical protein RR268_02070 [Kiritimatiellia bacterium]
MSAIIREIVIGFCSAFDMSSTSYQRPAFLTDLRTDAEILSQDWNTLCSDGVKAQTFFEEHHVSAH